MLGYKHTGTGEMACNFCLSGRHKLKLVPKFAQFKDALNKYILITMKRVMAALAQFKKVGHERYGRTLLPNVKTLPGVY